MMDNIKLKTSIERIEQISDTTPTSPRDYEDIVDSSKAAASLTASIERIEQISGETGPRPTFVDCEDIRVDATNVSLFCPECNAPIDYDALVTASNFERKLEEKRLKMTRDTEVSSSATEQTTHDEEAPAVPDVGRTIGRDTESPPSPTFYQVEATLVKDDSIREELPVYDAQPLAELPYLKKHAKGIIIFIIIFFVMLMAVIISLMLKTSADTIVDPPQYLNDSCISYVGPMYKADCDGCSPPIGVDGNDTICVWAGKKGSMGNESVDFFTHADQSLIEKISSDEIHFKTGGVEGSGVAISGNWAVVGSPEEINFSGAVYMYEKNSTDQWNLSERIVHDDLGEGYQFGRYVDIDNGVMVVSSSAYQGSVYVYHLQTDGTWAFEMKLTPTSALNKDYGGVVKVKGKRIAVGDRMFGYDPEGIVYLYKYSDRSWVLESTITNPECDGRFGVNLALEGENDLFIGCPMQSQKTGVVYYYSSVDGVYTLQQELSASQSVPGDRFGQTQQIAVYRNLLVIGEHAKKNGKATVFQRLDVSSNWTEISSIESPTNSTYFSDQVAMSGDNLVIASADNSYAYSLAACQ